MKGQSNLSEKMQCSCSIPYVYLYHTRIGMDCHIHVLLVRYTGYMYYVGHLCMCTTNNGIWALCSSATQFSSIYTKAQLKFIELSCDSHSLTYAVMYGRYH